MAGQNRLEEAEECADKLVSISINKMTCNAKVAILKGQKKLQESLEWIDKAIKLDPTSIALLYNKAMTLWDCEKYEECLDILDEAVERKECPQYVSEKRDKFLKENPKLLQYVKKSKLN